MSTSRRRPLVRLGDRAQIVALVATAIVMLLAGTAAFVLHERQRLLQEADELAIHQVDRLAQDLEKSLTVAEEAVHQIEETLAGQASASLAQFWAPEAASHRAQLLSSLPLPFELYAIDRQQHVTPFVNTRHASSQQVSQASRGFLPMPPLTPGQWHVGSTVGEPLSQIIPLLWPARPNAQGIVGFGVDLPILALLARLEADRVKIGGGVALFRMGPDGVIEVLARAPFKEEELGQPVKGHVAQVLASRAAGQFLTRGQFDGIERRVAFRRLTGTASDMVVVYGVPTRAVLAGWSRRLPVLVGACLALSMVLALGGWRLDRSVRRQRRAEAESRHRGETLEQVFEVLQDMLFVLDRQGTLVHFQSGSRELLYMPEEQFLGRRIHDVMPTALTQLIMQRLALAFDGTLQDFDYTLELPSGSHIFNARLARMPDSEHCMVVARDVTAQRQLQRDRERLNAFALVQLQMATRFINLHQDGIDDATSEGLREMAGFTGVERACLYRYEDDGARMTLDRLWLAPGAPSPPDWQATSQPDGFELVASHRAGAIFCVESASGQTPAWLRSLLTARQCCSLMMLPINTSRGCWGFLVFETLTRERAFSEDSQTLLLLFARMLSNTYERLMAEQAIAELTAELEARVTDRTRALDASVQRLQELNNQLQAFSYSVSHDLKSPLRSIEGFATLLIEEFGDQIPSLALDYLGRIRKSASHMARLISDLLAYSRLEQTEQTFETLELAPLVQGVIDGLGNEIEQQGAQIDLDLVPGLRVRASAGGLSLVVRNLIDNAMKFSRPGHRAHVRVAAQIDRARPDMVRLSVRDDGQGFDMKHHDRIFSLFQRLHRADQIPGTGIGLAMVHKAVTRMGGRIWAESSPGQGACFFIELPSGTTAA